MKKKIAVAAVSLALVAAAAMVFFSARIGHTERALTISAPASVVLAQLSDLQRWMQWLPRDQLDPRARRSFGGPHTGVGASYYWSSDDNQLGQGRMTVISASEQRVQIERELSKPRPSTLDIVFTLVPEGSGTRVAVSVTGQSDLAGNSLRPFSNAAAQLGPELDQALQHLAAAAEAQERVESSRVERSRSFAAAPAAIWQQLSEVRRWAAWSPWPGDDAKVRFSYGGHESRPGSARYWFGRDKKGQITIISAGPEKVVAEMETFTPQPSTTDLVFTLAPEGAGTKVTLSATGAAAELDLEKALARLSDVLVGELHAALEAP
jgi:hypothetical protein